MLFKRQQRQSELIVQDDNLIYLGCKLTSYNSFKNVCTVSKSKRNSESSKSSYSSQNNISDIDPPILITHKYIISLELNSPKHPQNWSVSRRSITVLLYAMISLGTQISSSMFGQSVELISNKYKITLATGMLPTSIFMFGLAFGPLFFGPLTERYGRRKGILIPYVLAGVVCCLTYFLKGFYTTLLMRFIGGFFASAPIISSGGALKDMFDIDIRADVLLCYAVLVASGPSFGPMIGGLITERLNGYHSLFLIIGGYMLVTVLISYAFIHESYVPQIVDDTKTKLRRKFNPSTRVSPLPPLPPRILVLSEREMNHTTSSLETYLIRPYKLLTTHLMAWIALYACTAFGVMYMGVSCMPLVIERTYGWSNEKSALFNVCHFIGILVGTIINIFVNKIYRNHTRRVRRGLEKWTPEKRLYAMIIGGVFTPMGFLVLWFTHSRHWLGIGTSQVLLGAGFFNTFQSALNYVIDMHGDWSASAVSAVTVLRSIAAGLLPIVATLLLDKVGVRMFCLTMFLVSLAMLSLPITIFFKWGKLRLKYDHIVKDL